MGAGVGAEAGRRVGGAALGRAVAAGVDRDEVGLTEGATLGDAVGFFDGAAMAPMQASSARVNVKATMLALESGNVITL